MQSILKIETALAKVSKSRTELRDVTANYNKMSLADFESKYPNVQLTKTMNADGVKTEYFKELIVGQPAFVEGADKIIAEMTADELRAYMEWDVIMSSASYLSDEIIAANFDFFGKTIGSVLQVRLKVRWARLLERCMLTGISQHLQNSVCRHW